MSNTNASKDYIPLAVEVLRHYYPHQRNDSDDFLDALFVISLVLYDFLKTEPQDDAFEERLRAKLHERMQEFIGEDEG